MPRTPLEKLVTLALPGEDFALDAIHLGPAGEDDGVGAVVAPPHPLYGGRMDNPVVSELAYACSRAGVASLRFDWRGAGASGGRPSGASADADADYAAALAHLAETVPGELVLCGYSFGAAAAVRAAAAAADTDPRVRRLVLVAPPPALVGASDFGSFAGPVLALVGEHDGLAPVAEVERLLAGRPRAELVVVPEADHFFAAGLADVGRAVVRTLGGA